MLQLLFFRPSLLLLALAWGFGEPSTFWKVMETTIQVQMLMCHKVTQKATDSRHNSVKIDT